jgi:CHAT domain-containing protein
MKRMKTPFPWLLVMIPGMMLQVTKGQVHAQPGQLTDEVIEVQGNLKQDEVMLEYHFTDSTVQVNAIAKESTCCAIQSIGRLFWYSLGCFRKKLKSAEPRTFSIPGEIMEMFLIKPVENFLTGKHRLIIIPGKQLSGLPFEAFIRNDNLAVPGKPGNLHYLIHDFEIVYHCSIECWNAMVKARGSGNSIKPGDNHFAFMGFSPAIKNSAGYSPLPGSKREIAGIGKLFHQNGFSSLLVCGENTGKDYFKSMAPRGRIVHLATHYIPDITGSSSGGFLFREYCPRGETTRKPHGLLTTDEIKDMQLEADLIVLNACASGVDRREPGVQYNSLPLLLFMAGARNVLSTLWNVTDNLAENFMLDFYRSWLSGKTYSAALREVKLQWINCSGTSIPTIWAPYILMGE